MRKTMQLHVIRDELACMRLVAKREFEGAVLDRISSTIDDVEHRWIALGHEPRITVGWSVPEGLLATAVHGLRVMVAKANGVEPPPSPIAEMRARTEAANTKRAATIARKAVREELRQADLAQRRAEREAARDAMPKPVRERPTPAKPKRAETAAVDPRQLSLF